MKACLDPPRHTRPYPLPFFSPPHASPTQQLRFVSEITKCACEKLHRKLNKCACDEAKIYRKISGRVLR